MAWRGWGGGSRCDGCCGGGGGAGFRRAEFCRREGLVPQTLSYWKRALSPAEAMVRRRRAARPVGLVPVRLVDTAMATAGGLEIALASGDRLVVREGVSRELLRDALLVLRERC